MLTTRDTWFPCSTEKGLIGRFVYIEQIDIPTSQRTGIPTMHQIAVLQERTSGNNDFISKKIPPDPIARKAMIDKWPQAWASFNGEDVVIVGTPLDQPFHDLTMTSGVRQKHIGYGITIWEQIADLSDASCSTLGFGEVKLRGDVMRAMGKTVPIELQGVMLSPGMSAEDAIKAMPGGGLLAELIRKMVAEQAPKGDVELPSRLAPPSPPPAEAAKAPAKKTVAA